MQDGSSWIVVLMGGGCLVLAALEVHSGRVLDRSPDETPLDRKERPVPYWLMVAFHSFLGALLVGLSLMTMC